MMKTNSIQIRENQGGGMPKGKDLPKRKVKEFTQGVRQGGKEGKSRMRDMTSYRECSGINRGEGCGGKGRPRNIQAKGNESESRGTFENCEIVKN